MKQDTLYQIGNTPFPSSAIASFYPETKQVSDKARRLEQEGRIVRLKRGLYVRSAEDGASLIPSLIANHLYGPSYVSMQTALRHYGLIPERVYETLSLTLKHSRTFDTPIGRFSYLSCPADYFPIGIRQEKEGEATYLIASPEKALCDLLLKTAGVNIFNTNDLGAYLETDLRFDMDALKHFDTEILAACHKYAPVKNGMIQQLTNLTADEQRHV